MSEKQEKNSIIESYDGDPDDLVFFQPPVQEEYDMEEADSGEYEEAEMDQPVKSHDKAYEYEGGEGKADALPEPEMVIYESESTGILVRQNPEGLWDDGQPEGMTGEIDLNDPHYANYQLDPYYDFGQGPEPKAKKTDDKKDGTSLGVVSLCTALAANLMCCCGISYLLSITALVTGIWCLCQKDADKSAKVMAIIGIILALLPFVLLILNMFSGFFVEILNDIY